jgi:hypothetical protein
VPLCLVLTVMERGRHALALEQELEHSESNNI